MKTHSLKKILGAAAAALLAMQSANAVTINLTVGIAPVTGWDDRALGDIVNNLSGGGAEQRDADLVNALLPLALNATTTLSGQAVTRSDNAFGSLPTALPSVHTDTPDAFWTTGQTTLSLTLTTLYTYFTASYDGPNGGAEAYYIGNLNVGDVINITRFAQPAGSPAHLLADPGKFQMTGFGFLNPTTAQSVPDGGLSVALLGCSLAGIDFLRRKLQRS